MKRRLFKSKGVERNLTVFRKINREKTSTGTRRGASGGAGRDGEKKLEQELSLEQLPPD